MKHIQILIIFLLVSKIIYSQNYPVYTIPDSLKKNADAVIREYNVEIDIKSESKFIVKTKFVVTILNKNAEVLSYFREGYDKFSKIDFEKGNIYNSAGKNIGKIKNKNLEDISTYSYTGFDDARIKIYIPIVNSYPITVEYIYKKEYNSIFYLNFFTPYSYTWFNLSCENASLTVKSTGNNIRFNEKNIKIEPKIEEIDNSTTYLWTFTNLLAIEGEIFSPNDFEIFPIIDIAPKSFSYDGFNGNMETWNNLGKWFGLLNKDRLYLKPETVSKVNELITETTDTIKKIKIIYEYMQSKTRYVSIQVGIGGFQPFKAEFVDKTCYGDCKALSFYTKALLNAIGIKSNYVLVSAGKDYYKLDENFSANYFNHAILCVPLQKDTIWLECTDQKIPFGYIGTHTDDRNALLITENGGKIVRTRAYSQKENLQKRTAEVEILLNGNAKAQINTIFSGLQYEKRRRLIYETPTEQKKTIYKLIDIPDYKINKFSISNDKKIFVPAITENLDLEISNFISFAGNRMIFNPNLLNIFEQIPPKNNNRINDIIFKRAYSFTDSISYIFPETYKIEYLPVSESIESEFGSYSNKFVNSNNSIIYIRNLKTNSGIFKANKYNKLINYYTKISNADKQKIILIEK